MTNELVKRIVEQLPNDYYVQYKPNPDYQISLRKDLTQDHFLTDLGVELSSRLHLEIATGRLKRRPYLTI